MSWSDILYPDNPKRREKVIQDIQKLEDYMAQNFRATNKLATFLNTHKKGADISMIQVDSKKSLKENAETLTNQVKEIKKYIKNLDEDIKKELDPTLYEKLISVDTSFEEKIEIGKKVSHVIAGITGVTVTGVVGKLLSTKLMEKFESRIARIALSSVAGAIAGAVAGIAVDVIAGSITGAYERGDLKEAIKTLEKDIDDFLPASEEYTDDVYEVLAEARNYEKHHKSK